MTEENPKTFPAMPFVGSEFPDEAFEEVHDILLRRRGFDLGMYKDRCIKRRIAIRVRALGLQDAESYLGVLRRKEDEVDALLAVLTIHVSQFFRNPSTYAVLKKSILPELIRRAEREQRELRLWSVGCAGGEEPYSLALLVDDLTRDGVRAAILGTDISAPILEQAREGVFGFQRLAEVSEEVRERYFTPEGKGFFRLREEIRGRVRFEKHDVLKASEYPAADLILCRNVLIYFSRAEQERILERFAEALAPRGFLVLGRAETLLGSVRRLFSVENPEERIYRRI